MKAGNISNIKPQLLNWLESFFLMKVPIALENGQETASV
jgi:hypothetical protein